MSPAPTKPAIVFLLAAVTALSGCRGEGAGVSPPPVEEPPSGPPSILLVSIDTTRADRLGAYGRHPSPTPHLDRWAGEGVVFENALTPVPMTLPAHTTLLTGWLPHRHGVRDNGVYRVPDDVPTLAEALAGHGYDTAAVVGAAVLDRQFGLERGFGSYSDVTSAGGGLAIAERRAAQVTDAAVKAVSGLEPPFFLFVHYFDPHAVYAPPPEFARRFPEEPYVGEIAYVDAEIGRLRATLEDRGLLAGAVVVVTSDHGEGLGEHGEETHGAFLYHSTLHVPLLVAAPGRWPAGRRIPNTVSLADVTPTLLALAGLPAPEAADGQSLALLLDADAPSTSSWLPLETEFGWNSYGWAPLVGMTNGQVKWVGAPRPELYDLAADPREQDDLSEEDPGEVQRLAALWKERVGEDRRARPLGGSTGPEAAEQLARLEALGYVLGAAVPAPADTRHLPDPKDAIAGLALVNQARGLMAQGRQPEAQSVLRQALDSGPRNVSALTLLGVSHLLAGQPRPALAPLERAAELAPANADVQFNLGLAQAGLGNVPAAEAALRRAVALAPRNHDAAVTLVDLLVNTGRPDLGWGALQRAREQGLASPQLDFLEGKLAAARGDRGAARRLLQRSLSGDLPPAAAAQARELLRTLG